MKRESEGEVRVEGEEDSQDHAPSFFEQVVGAARGTTPVRSGSSRVPMSAASRVPASPASVADAHGIDPDDFEFDGQVTNLTETDAHKLDDIHDARVRLDRLLVERRKMKDVLRQYYEADTSLLASASRDGLGPPRRVSSPRQKRRRAEGEEGKLFAVQISSALLSNDGANVLVLKDEPEKLPVDALLVERGPPEVAIAEAVAEKGFPQMTLNCASCSTSQDGNTLNLIFIGYLPVSVELSPSYVWKPLAEVTAVPIQAVQLRSTT